MNTTLTVSVCYSHIKGAIKICPFYEDGSEPPHVFGNVPSTSPEECVVRVYVVRVSHCLVCLDLCVTLCSQTHSTLLFPIVHVYGGTK